MISNVIDPRHLRRSPGTRGRTRALPALAAVAAAALAVTACGSGGSSGGGAAGPTKGHITLTVLSGDGGDPGLLTGYKALNKAFEAKHPGVTVKFATKDFTDLMSTIKLELSGSNPPDVTQVNQGYQAGSMGPLVTDGLLLSLDSYAKRYGWTGRQSAAMLALNGRFTSDGKTFGSGPLYGIAATGAWVGLYENKRIAHTLGITSPPTTLAALEHDLAMAKAHGDVPLQFDAYQSSWLMASLLLPGSPQIVSNVVYAKPGTAMTSPQMQTVGQTIRTWGTKGYFPPDWAANKSSGVFGAFLAGKSLFTVDGSWEVPLPATAHAADFAMLQFPSAGGSSAPSAVASGDLPWAIPAKSKHQALAAQYIDFITSATAANTWVKVGAVPATLPPDPVAAANAAHLVGPSKDALLGWAQILAKGTPVPFIDWATPTFLNTIQSSVAEVGAGKITPQAFTSALQADYGKFAATRH
jgi:raffinose/stachyose/melibiose transport system substrate-binding protein